MRRPLASLVLAFRCVALAAAVGAGGAAHAGPLYSATWSQTIQGVELTFTGTDTNADGIADIGGGTCQDTLTTHVDQTIVCPQSIGAAGFSSGSSYNVSVTLPLFSLRQATTGGIINVHTVATLGGSASIQGDTDSATANQGVDGMLTVKLARHVSFGANASKLTPAQTTLLRLPLDVGHLGAQTGYFYVLSLTHYFTVDFYGWTPGTRTFTGLTSKYAFLPTPTVVAMGSHDLTNYGGTVILVAPSRISVDGPFAQRRTAEFTTLKLVYSPEPSLVLLLAAGAAGLGACARRKPVPQGVSARSTSPPPASGSAAPRTPGCPRTSS